jgi:uncharacterized damage-inducible protein DinB
MSADGGSGSHGRGSLDHLRRLFEWNAWANRTTLQSLADAGEAPERALAIMAHLVAAEWLWLSRLRGEPDPGPVWPAWSLERCRDEAGHIAVEWRSWVGPLEMDALGRKVAYVNSLGESWTNAVEDILLHVIAHSAYHRGQVALALRSDGHEPAYSDYVHALRQGLVE